MFAAIDLGSNSFRLHIARVQDQRMHIVRTARVPVRLGAGLDDHGFLTPQAMQSAVKALEGFSRILAPYPLHGMRVVGTQALRCARNADAFLERARYAMDHPIEVISGHEEGRLIYLGVAQERQEDVSRRLVVDVGGGSTEVVLGQQVSMEDIESFPIGTVPVNKAHFADGRITASGFASAIEASRSVFAQQAARFAERQWRTAYGSSGTMRAIRELLVRNGLATGPITPRGLLLLRERLIACGRADRIDLVGLKRDRMDMICAGIALVSGLMEAFDIPALTPTPAGLRIGVLWDLHLHGKPCDRRDESIAAFAHRFHANDRQGKDASGLACSMAAPLFDEAEAGQSSWMKRLDWAARLHAVGMAVSRRDYHKHGAYLIGNAKFDGLTDTDQRHVSALVLGQKGSLKKLGETIENPDFARCVLALRLTILLLRAEATSAAPALRARLKDGVRIQLKKTTLDAYPALRTGLDRERQWWAQAGINYSVREQ